MKKREAQAAAARQKLLDTTKMLISQKDYDLLTIQDITSACGMSVGNFYHYFKSKEEVFVEIERGPYDDFFASLDKYAQAPVETQLFRYLEGYVTLLQKEPAMNINRQWFRYHLNDALANPPRPNKMDIVKNEVLTIIRRGIEQGELDQATPAEDLALQMSMLIHGISLYNVMCDGAFDITEWVHNRHSIVTELLRPYVRDNN